VDSNILARSAVDGCAQLDVNGCRTLVRRCIESVKVQVELLMPYVWRAACCFESSACWYAIGGRRYRLVQDSVSLDVAVIVSAGYIASAGARRSELLCHWRDQLFGSTAIEHVLRIGPFVKRA
jgi:hypothetical protein